MVEPERLPPPAPTPAPRPATVPWHLVAGWLVALALIAPYVLTARHLPDEFAFCNVAVRLAHGEAFGRDVFCFMMPGPFFVTAALFKLVGASLFAARALQACLIALMGVIYWRLARALGAGRWLALLPALFLLVVIVGAYYYFGHRWFSQGLVAVTLALVWRALRRETTAAWGLAGVAAGLTYVMQQLDGAALVAGLAAGTAWAAWRQGWALPVAARRLAAAAAGWALPLALLALAFWAQGVLAEAFYDTHTWPLTRYRNPGGPNDVPYLTDFAYMFSTTGPWLSRLYWYASTVVILVGPLLPLGVVVGGLAWLAGLGRRGERDDPATAMLGVLVVVAAMVFLAGLRGRADTTHLLAVSMPHVLLLTAAIARWERWLPAGSSARGLRFVPRLALAAIVAAGALRFTERVRLQPADWLTFATPDARLRHHPSIEAVAKLVRPGDMVLAGIHSAIFNFYVAPNPSRWVIDWSPPADGYTTAAQYDELVADVRRKPTRLLIITAGSQAMADGYVRPLLDQFAPRLIVPNPVPPSAVALQTYVYERRTP